MVALLVSAKASVIAQNATVSKKLKKERVISREVALFFIELKILARRLQY